VRHLSLAALRATSSFALLGPGFGEGNEWTLLTELSSAETGAAALWLASYETPGAHGRRLAGRAEPVSVSFEEAPTPTVTLEAEGFPEGVAHIRDAIAAGDVYQVNLTVRARVAAVDGAALLSRLCRRGVPRFAAWARLPGGPELVSASPELLFEVHGRRVRAEPMKGTAPPERRAWLEASEKDRAELAMITDLLRDDLNRLCEPGSVEVPCARRFIELPYAVQTVSDVTGLLRESVTLREVLGQLHPGGSVTGAPREAARAVIAHLEPSPRGVYCGALGLERGDRARFALLIRTAERQEDGAWTYGVGGGITWDSDPAAELEEVRLKLGALT
jgi:anthranilate/para-aminobenzoate synthase component I